MKLAKSTLLAATLSIAQPFAASANDNQFTQADSIEALEEHFIFYGANTPKNHEKAQSLTDWMNQDGLMVQYRIVPASGEIAEGSIQFVDGEGLGRGRLLAPQEINTLYSMSLDLQRGAEKMAIEIKELERNLR